MIPDGFFIFIQESPVLQGAAETERNAYFRLKTEDPVYFHTLSLAIFEAYGGILKALRPDHARKLLSAEAEIVVKFLHVVCGDNTKSDDVTKTAVELLREVLTMTPDMGLNAFQRNWIITFIQECSTSQQNHIGKATLSRIRHSGNAVLYYGHANNKKLYL